MPPAARTAQGVQAVASAPADEVNSLSFEDALAELEQIVRGLEGGQQKLEEAITAYERGSRLRRHCEAKLAQAEQRVQVIVAAGDGALSLRAAD
jgi:exodeoxyribonuclease VII small subunit